MMVCVFAAILATSLFLVGPVNAQTVAKPSVPEFSVKYVESYYEVPATTSTNPYNGQTTTSPSYHIPNKAIEVTITNQPFTSYQENGQIINLTYNIRVKGPYTVNWTNVYTPDNRFLPQSDGAYTTVAFSVTGADFPFWGRLEQGGTVEVQVEALIGYVHRSSLEFAAPFVFEGQESGWSSTQAVTIPAQATTTPTQTPATTPTDAATDNLQANSVTGDQPFTNFAIIAAAVAGIIIAGSLIVVVTKRQMVKSRSLD
jgi:hypothetical protein